MWVTYRPEDQPDEAEQRWEFNSERVRTSEAEIIEKRYGANWDTWRNDVRSGSAKARRVLLWHLLRREHPRLRYEDTPDFLMAELLVEHSVAELLELRDRLAKAKVDDESMREQMAAALDIEITDAMAREGIAELDGAAGKAPSPNSGDATG
ncbi:hypothetical protein QTQ03_25275 [Micromonospora sp. WMMA1363]|uniref:hypothetical protein n=1 Tax=Micromonospora sp. WMMA1363 TaxID=3053985 RepID=UPI00259D2912|nr:hypothetical protein [Micromonospora sp. WMMA1363]MDM4722747.1 hypothetical protein [Micromonospora sp. WMMA1363]